MKEKGRYHDVRPDNFPDHLPPFHAHLSAFRDVSFFPFPFPFPFVLILVRIDLADGRPGCTYQTCILFFLCQKILVKGRKWERWKRLTRIGAGESAYMYMESIRVKWDFEAGLYGIRFCEMKQREQRTHIQDCRRLPTRSSSPAYIPHPRHHPHPSHLRNSFEPSALPP